MFLRRKHPDKDIEAAIIEFELTFQLREGESGEQYLNALAEAGCDDASVIPHARLIEAGPDLVGLTDMGEIFGVSRQHMRQFILEHDNAPSPVHSGNPKLWHLSDISDWMSSINAHIRGAGISRECAELARTTLAVNFARRWLTLQPPDLAREEVIKAADRELPKQFVFASATMRSGISHNRQQYGAGALPVPIGSDQAKRRDTDTQTTRE